MKTQICRGKHKILHEAEFVQPDILLVDFFTRIEKIRERTNE